MAMTEDFLEGLSMMADRSPGPRHLPWPIPGNPGALVEFSAFADWRDFFMAFRLPGGVPGHMTDAFDRALKIALLAWVDADLYVAAEMAALSALEHALRDCYLGIEKQRRLTLWAEEKKKEGKTLTERDNEKAGQVYFAELLKVMVREEKLTDDMIPLARNCGVNILPLLTGEIRVINGGKEKIVRFEPSLADMRNGRAHGNPFESALTAGLIELVRDLMEFAYRKRIEEMRRIENAVRTQ